MLITALSGITLTTSLALLLRGYYEGYRQYLNHTGYKPNDGKSDTLTGWFGFSRIAPDGIAEYLNSIVAADSCKFIFAVEIVEVAI